MDRVEYVDINNRDLERVGGGGVDLDMASSRNPGVSDTEPGRATGGSIGGRSPGGQDTEPVRARDGSGPSTEAAAVQQQGMTELSAVNSALDHPLWCYSEESGATAYVGGVEPTALLPANAIRHNTVEFMAGIGGHAWGMRLVLNIVGAAESCGHMCKGYALSLIHI